MCTFGFSYLVAVECQVVQVLITHSGSDVQLIVVKDE